MIRAEVQPSQTDPDRFDVVSTSAAGSKTIVPLGFQSHALAEAVARSIEINAELDGEPEDPEPEDVDLPSDSGNREILVHLNVEAPLTDERTADQIADAILGALEVGSDDPSVEDLKIVCPMAEEV